MAESSTVMRNMITESGSDSTDSEMSATAELVFDVNYPRKRTDHDDELLNMEGGFAVDEGDDEEDEDAVDDDDDDEEETMDDAEETISLRLSLFGNPHQPYTVYGDPTPPLTDIQLRYSIGSGGFGRVYLGSITAESQDGGSSLSSLVAVKLFRGRDVDSSRRPTPQTLQELRAEAHGLWLNHENVVQTLAVGWLAPDDNEDRILTALSASTTQLNAAVVMEFVDGKTLWSVISDHSESLDFRRRAR